MVIAVPLHSVQIFQDVLSEFVDYFAKLFLELLAVPFLQSAGPPCVPELFASAKVHADIANITVLQIGFMVCRIEEGYFFFRCGAERKLLRILRHGQSIPFTKVCHRHIFTEKAQCVLSVFNETSVLLAGAKFDRSWEKNRAGVMETDKLLHGCGFTGFVVTATQKQTCLRDHPSHAAD